MPDEVELCWMLNRHIFDPVSEQLVSQSERKFTYTVGDSFIFADGESWQPGSLSGNAVHVETLVTEDFAVTRSGKGQFALPIVSRELRSGAESIPAESWYLVDPLVLAGFGFNLPSKPKHLDQIAVGFFTRSAMKQHPVEDVTIGKNKEFGVVYLESGRFVKAEIRFTAKVSDFRKCEYINAYVPYSQLRSYYTDENTSVASESLRLLYIGPPRVSRHDFLSELSRGGHLENDTVVVASYQRIREACIAVQKDSKLRKSGRDIPNPIIVTGVGVVCLLFLGALSWRSRRVSTCT